MGLSIAREPRPETRESRLDNFVKKKHIYTHTHEDEITIQ